MNFVQNWKFTKLLKDLEALPARLSAVAAEENDRAAAIDAQAVQLAVIASNARQRAANAKMCADKVSELVL